MYINTDTSVCYAEIIVHMNLQRLLLWCKSCLYWLMWVCMLLNITSIPIPLWHNHEGAVGNTGGFIMPHPITIYPFDLTWYYMCTHQILSFDYLWCVILMFLALVEKNMWWLTQSLWFFCLFKSQLTFSISSSLLVYLLSNGTFVTVIFILFVTICIELLKRGHK